MVPGLEGPVPSRAAGAAGGAAAFGAWPGGVAWRCVQNPCWLMISSGIILPKST